MKLELNKKKGAFTLIELLVVIAIIGILSGLIVVSMSGATNSANDAKRKANLDVLKKALMYNGTLNGGTYPIQTTLCTIGGGATPCTVLASALSEMVPNLPVDPVSGYYTYISDVAGTRFTLSGNLSSGAMSYSNNGGYSDGAVDVDGNAYGSVVIGTQTWMTSNLMTTKYKDGTAIARGPTGTGWDGTDHGYYAYPPAVGNTAEETLANIQSNKLGFVYQWSAANSGKLCPAGWHVPTDTEYCTLEQFVDPSISCSTTGWRGTDGGSRLKESGTTHWTSPNTGATNSSGFTGLGTGCRGTDGSFDFRSVNTDLWSSTVSGTSAWHRLLFYSNTTVYRATNSQAFGFSVRCVKD